MAHDTHDVGLTALSINGIAHGLSVDGKAFVGLTIDLIPALQSLVEVKGIDADETVANNGLARHAVAPAFTAATEALSSLGAEALGPVRDGFVAAHAAEDGARGDGQNHRQRMASPLGTARIGDLREELG